jgi:hypothetical protein
MLMMRENFASLCFFLVFQVFFLLSLALEFLLNLLDHFCILNLEFNSWNEVLIEVFKQDESSLLKSFNPSADQSAEIILID